MFHTNFDERQKLWSGHNSPPLYNPEVSFGKVIYHALRVHGTKVAQVIIFDNSSLSFNKIIRFIYAALVFIIFMCIFLTDQ